MVTHTLRVGIQGEQSWGTVLGPQALIARVCVLYLGKCVVFQVPQDHFVSFRHIKRVFTECSVVYYSVVSSLRFCNLVKKLTM